VSNNDKEIIVLGGGCFWCTKAVFKNLKGVISVLPGYAGGIKPDSGDVSYEDVSSGKTGHAEVVKIEYNPNKISLKTLLTVFFATHDPTTLNRQGNDIGTQYRSIILYTGEKQRQESEKFIKGINESSKLGAPIVTEILPIQKFYKAEDYHLDYYAKNKNAGYCQLVINPKLERVQKEFAELLKK